jgi:hypothetical protein
MSFPAADSQPESTCQIGCFRAWHGRAVTARLSFRRVRELNRHAAGGQQELFPAWRYHAIFAKAGTPTPRQLHGHDELQLP